jgi:outer membrane protein
MREIAALFLICLLYQGANADTVNNLSLNDYISIALKNNPQLKGSMAQYESSLADVSKSRSALLPSISASAGTDLSYSKGATSNISRAGSNTYNPLANNSTQNNPSVGYSAGIQAQQTLFAFGKNQLQLKSSELNSDASKQDLSSVRQTTIMNAASAYYNYLLSLELLNVNRELVSQATNHLEQAKALVEIGNQAAYTVTKAQVDLANANVEMVIAVNSVKLAKVQLETAAGISIEDSVKLTDSLSAAEDQIDLNYALETAKNKNPDILSSQIRLQAAEVSKKAARAAYFPEIGLTGSMGYGNNQDNDWRTNWSAGVNVSVPIFSGGATSASVSKAVSAEEKAQADLRSSELDLQSQVQKSFLSKEEALERIKATETLLEQAREGLTLSEERYKAGSGTSLEITDAQATFASAAKQHVQALYDYHIAHLNLLKTIGLIDKQ